MISPMLDNFMIGDAINERDGLRTYPAMRQETEEKYIVKVISVPSSPAKLDALILSGAYHNRDSALAYFRTLAEEIVAEADTLKQLSQLEGFLAFEDCCITENDTGNGYDVYLLSTYKRSLSKLLQSAPLTHLAAANIGLDLCAALTVARRAGYLYADLRPDNIYITPEGEYKIGDIGFVRLDGLKYATLSDRYRSSYTAPEALDAYSAPSDTMDVFALGLILYQIYNNNILPAPTEDGAAFAAPQYADYELSEIILKACATNPEDRWASPVEMGQAIVNYMQRNGISDEPIIPIPVEEPVTGIVSEDVVEEPEINETTEETVNLTECEVPENSAESAEDELGDLSILEDTFTDAEPEEIVPESYDLVSDEVSEILEQVDELASLEVPDPVVAPEAIEVPVPVIEEETPAADETQVVEVPTESADAPTDEMADATVAENTETEEIVDNEEPPKRKKSKWLRNSIIILLILAALAACAYFFVGYYFVPIDNLRIEGREDMLIVYVESKIDDSLLEVECSFPEGTPIVADVKDGKAVFTGLTHDTGYTIKVRVKSRFRRVTGESSTAYSTPAQTSLLHFSATTGMSDGSMVLTFSVVGPESKEWTVTYWTDDEEKKSVSFPNHSITIEGLTIGKVYTFQLNPEDDLYLDGNWEIKATASELIYAQDIVVTEFLGQKLTVTWAAPEDKQVESWTVRCYNDEGYSNTVVVQDTTVTFTDVDATCTYNIEIIAQGMTDSKPSYAYANSYNITDFAVTEQENGTLLAQWNSDRALPEGSWITYSIDGYSVPLQVPIVDNTATIPNVVPGAEHRFIISSPDGDHFVGEPMVYHATEASTFSCSYYYNDVSAEDMEFKMCITPEKENWTVYTLTADDYTTTFSAGQKASFLVYLNATPGYSEDIVQIQYVIRDSEGKIVNISTDSGVWFFLWVNKYGTFDIPTIPQEAGTYTIDVLFNGAFVTSQEFTIN